MEVIIVIILIVTLIYTYNILYLLYGISKMSTFHFFDNEPKTKFSIIVPFRNENENLPTLLNTISLLDYPTDLFEVILVDDESTEKFQIPNFKFQATLIENIRLTNSPKKDAINTAITKAKHNWIITTDADCIVHPKWLKTFDNYIQKHHPKMIAGGVKYKMDGRFISDFQQLDMLSLQGTTMGSFGNGNAFMCNGANFCYQKVFFYELNGFEGNSNIASGDDVFLLQKGIKKEAESVHFLKADTAIIETQTEKTWLSLLYQRVRWASKTVNYTSFYAKQLGLSVFLMNLLILFVICGLWFIEKSLLWLLLLKFSTDFCLLYKSCSFYKTRMRNLLLSSLLYPFFSTLVVMYALFGNYTWKGRTFKK